MFKFVIDLSLEIIIKRLFNKIQRVSYSIQNSSTLLNSKSSFIINFPT